MPKYNWPFLNFAPVTIIKQSGLGPNTHAFRVPHNFGKPHIQSYFEQLYGAEIVNINTMNIDPRKWMMNGKRRRFYGYKKAYITFAKPFTMDWTQYEKQPHCLYTLHNKHLKARGKKVNNPEDMQLNRKKAAPEQ
mmetsp:Transcript_58300/g.96634  ORF Transcript_58300/g.96634 Transcript_58300/m.96634 type:complete len:135 (+) Transcript_58300:109-513(+)